MKTTPGKGADWQGAADRTASFRILLALPVVFGRGTGIVTPRSTTAMISGMVTRGDYGAARGGFSNLGAPGTPAARLCSARPERVPGRGPTPIQPAKMEGTQA